MEFVRCMRKKSVCACKSILSFSIGMGPCNPSRRILRTTGESVSRIDLCPSDRYEQLEGELTRGGDLPRRCFLFKGKTTRLFFSIILTRGPGGTLLPVPTFTRCRRTLQAMSYRVICRRLGERGGFTLARDFLRRLARSVSLMFLYSPSGPSNRIVRPRLVRRVLAQYRRGGVHLILSRYFVRFLRRTRGCAVIGGIASRPDLFLMRTFAGVCKVPKLELKCTVASSKRLERQVRRVHRP